MKTFDLANWGPLDREFRENFLDDIAWPISKRTLVELIDLGMSDITIGSYFNVTADDVLSLRQDYKIPDRRQRGVRYGDS